MGFYDGVAETARELLTEAGAPVVLRRTVGTFDPVQASPSSKARTEASTVGVKLSATSRIVRESLAEGAEGIILIANDATPILSDLVRFAGKQYALVQIDPVEPAGSAIVYLLHVRA